MAREGRLYVVGGTDQVTMRWPLDGRGTAIWQTQPL